MTADTLDTLYDDLEESGGRNRQGLSAKTVVNVHGVLHKALADAAKRGKLTRNPADVVEAPRAGRHEHNIWTVQQLRAFLRQVRGDEQYAAWPLFATTGMRRGEVAGLAREDLDLDAGTVRVTWTLGVIDNQATWNPGPKATPASAPCRWIPRPSRRSAPTSRPRRSSACASGLPGTDGRPTRVACTATTWCSPGPTAP
ncbi:MAG: tyrosine-type recombinase/integrase [Egibacteraceae bacterium]